MLFDFFPVKRQEKTNSLVRKHKFIRFTFRNDLLRKNTVAESGAPSLLQKEKRRSAKFDVLKVLFPDIGKITNPNAKLETNSVLGIINKTLGR